MQKNVNFNIRSSEYSNYIHQFFINTNMYSTYIQITLMFYVSIKMLSEYISVLYILYGHKYWPDNYILLKLLSDQENKHTLFLQFFFAGIFFKKNNFLIIDFFKFVLSYQNKSCLKTYNICSNYYECKYANISFYSLIHFLRVLFMFDVFLDMWLVYPCL